MSETKELGYVTNASTSTGIESILSDYEATEDIATNSIAIIEGKKRKYLSIISEVFHSAGSERASNAAKYLSENSEAKNIGDVALKSLSATKKLSTSMRLIPLAQTSKYGVEEVDTIPVHAGKVVPPKKEDIETFYGNLDEKVNWGIGFSKHPVKDSELKVM